MDADTCIAYADAMRAQADKWTLKRVKKLANQLRAGAEKVERWQELELTKHMVGKLRLREMFKTWRLAVDLAALVKSGAEEERRYDELEKEKDEIEAKYVGPP